LLNSIESTIYVVVTSSSLDPAMMMLRSRLYKPGQVRKSDEIFSVDGPADALCLRKGGMHLGGGITAENAQHWLDAGAEKVIVTSYLFPHAKFSLERLEELAKRIGKENLVVDVR
jgi:hypothetical protein